MKGKGRAEKFPSPLLEGDGASAELLRRFIRQPPHVPPEATAWDRTLALLGREAGRHRRRLGLALATGAAIGAVVLYVAISQVGRWQTPRPASVTAATTATAIAAPPSAATVALSPSTSHESIPPMGDIPQIQLGRASVGLPVGRARLLHEAEVILSPTGRARAFATPTATTVALVVGELELRVEKRPPEAGRVFQVLAEPYQFTVLGTAFRVSRGGGQIRLYVSEGRVLVSRGPKDLTVVTTGGAWAGADDGEPPRATRAAVEAETEAPPRAPPGPPVVASGDAVAERSPVGAPEPARLVVPAPPEPPKLLAPTAAPASDPVRCATGADQDPAAAVACFLTAARGADVGAEVALYEAAQLYRDAMGDPGRAIATLREARRRFPAGALGTEIDLSLVELLPKVGRYREALDESAAILSGRLGGERANELHLLRGDILRAGLGDCAAADGEYVAAASAASERVSDPASFWRALCLEQRNRPAEARRAFEEYLARPHPARQAEAAHHLETLGGGAR